VPFFVVSWKEIIKFFEDTKKTVVELKIFIFQTLQYWTASLDFNMLSFMIFFTCFLFLIRCFLLYTPCILELRLCAFNDILCTY
jgi:hypothetical protein